ncbi:MAG: signal recognition particle protein [Armatimonadota bacterium]|nr:signal recognition particle protein [Armatimonadota bacterium]MDR7422080.1 signal recognition particle protein [Armatimonadota bacterium]MDR7454144.1 signal recognition particle protein [Armatimonadota bacterium]MDR7456243.1 signal recognition particle protein [Armatimonadota bacterium]MDR7496889.1 signal recognition particle protein [Armatimonadota bacterium]
MFEGLQARLGEIVKRLTGRGALSPEDVDAALREVRLALLEADVNFKVAREFVERVRQAAVGQEVWKHLSPGQQVVKIVHRELTSLLGGATRELRFAPQPPTVVLLVGLHGVGKTTTAGKLAALLRRRGRAPLLVATDLRRPAAVRQLQVVGAAVRVPVFAPEGATDPVAVARRAVAQAVADGHDVVVVDSAGRQHADDALMAELAAMHEALRPQETLLVLDAMAGQDAVRMAEQFAARLRLDGLILTKLDGDARGGAALSAVAATGLPILFVGTGERPEALETFHPDRMASRILGMGDVLTLIERAEQTLSAEQAAELERKLRRAQFTFADFLDQLRQVRQMGPIDQLLEMIPGFSRAKLPGLTVDESQLRRIEAMIQSMTPQERAQPQLIDGSRRRRIAAGSGTTVQDVNRLLKQFDQVRRLMRQFDDRGRMGRLFPGR